MRTQREQYREHLLAVVLFSILAFLLSFPSFSKPCGTVPTSTDSWQNIWNFWHVHQALSKSGVTLFHTDLLFHPLGTGLELTNLTFLFTVPLSVFQRFLSPEFALNFSLFIATVLSGYCTYLLCRSLGLSKTSSLLSGFIFTFCPVRMLYTLVGQLDTSAAFCLPLCAWLYRRFRDAPSLNATLYLGLGLTASALISWYFAVMAAFLLIILITTDATVQLIDRKRPDRWIAQPKNWGLLALSVIIPVVLLSPLVLVLLSASGAERVSDSPEAIGIGASADILAFVLPDPNPLWRSSFARLTGLHLFMPMSVAQEAYRTFRASPLNKAAFVGYLPLALAYGTVLIRKKKKLVPWAVLVISGAILALGPRIQMGGRIGALMPMSLLYKFSCLKMFRTPQRFTLLYLLGMSVLSAMSVEHVLRRLPKLAPLIVSAVALILLLEFLTVPNLLLEPVQPASPVLKTLADQQRSPILNVPVACTPDSAWYASRYLYLQTLHGQPMLFGYTSRLQGQDLTGVSDRYPVLKQISVARVFGVSSDAEERNRHASDFSLSDDELENLKSALDQIGIQRVLVHKDMLGAKPSRDMIEALTSSLGNPVLEDETLVLFEVQ